MALKFNSNVTHNGILFKAGDIVAGLESIAENVIARGLAEVTDAVATHSSVEADESGRAKPVDPATVPAEPTQAEIDAENAAREAELAKQAEAQRATAQAQVAAAQPGVPTAAEIEQSVASIQ